MKYQVIRTCYYNQRLYDKGEIVTLEGSVPEHFSPLPEEKKLEDMSVTELKKLATEKGLNIKTNRKNDLINALRG